MSNFYTQTRLPSQPKPGPCRWAWGLGLGMYLVVCLNPASLLAQQPAKSKLTKASCTATDLAPLTQAFSKGASFRAQFIQRSANPSDPKRIRQAGGAFEYQFPGKMRWHYTSPDEQLLVTDGKTMWLYDPLLNNVVVQPLPKKGAYTPLRVFLGAAAVGEAFFCHTTLHQTPRGVALKRLLLLPRKADNMTAKLVLDFTRDQGRLHQLRIVDVHGGWQSIRFFQVKKHPPLAPEHFVFIPPPGSEVITP